MGFFFIALLFGPYLRRNNNIAINERRTNMIVEQKRVVEIASTPYILKFSNGRDFSKVKRYLENESCYSFSEERFDIIEVSVSNDEICIDIANDYIDTFVSVLREMPDMQAGFIMTKDLTCDPDYTFGPEVNA